MIIDLSIIHGDKPVEMIAPSLSQTSNITLPGVAMTSLLTWLKSQLYLRQSFIGEMGLGISWFIMGLVISPAPFFNNLISFLGWMVPFLSLGSWISLDGEIHDPKNLRLWRPSWITQKKCVELRADLGCLK
jgi:hypothetical protein